MFCSFVPRPESGHKKVSSLALSAFTWPALNRSNIRICTGIAGSDRAIVARRVGFRRRRREPPKLDDARLDAD